VQLHEEGCRTGEFTVGDISIATTAVLGMLNGIREWFSPDGPLPRTELIDRTVAGSVTRETIPPTVQ